MTQFRLASLFLENFAYVNYSEKGSNVLELLPDGKRTKTN